MKITAKILGFIILLTIIYSFAKQTDVKKESVYTVVKLKKSMKIDANWDKPQWRSVKPIEINNYRKIPAFRPTTQAKMMYDKNNIYVIFRVNDRYVRSVLEEYNAPVSSDACVEFFFAPDINEPLKYFNLETNAGGTPLMRYQMYQKTEPRHLLTAEELNQIEIAHSLPKKIDPEITEPVTWTLEYRVPIDLLKKIANVVAPKAGVIWKANFYKIAGKTSNPHSVTWSVIRDEKSNFHSPQFFGTLRFK